MLSSSSYRHTTDTTVFLTALLYPVMVFAAPLVAAVGLVAIYGVLNAAHRGPEAVYWNRMRSRYLPRLDRLARRLRLGYAAYELHPRELAGTIDQPVEQVGELLATHGFERMPLSAWKTLADGRSEAGSWALREHPLAERQLHVMLFTTDDNATELYVHDEFNAFHPRYAARHYHGVDYDPKTGRARLTELLGDHLSQPATRVEAETDPLNAHERTPADGRPSDTTAAE